MAGSAGRLCPVKDYPFMIDVAKAVKEETKRIEFHLAGEGPERAKLQALIQQHNLNETFVLQGHIEDMLPFYRSLDLYLNTSVHEGIPMSILEAIKKFNLRISPPASLETQRTQRINEK